MPTINLSDREYAQGIDALSSACNRLILAYVDRGGWDNADHEQAFNLLFNLAKGLERDRLVPVYRRQQPCVFSCMREDCRPCNRGKYNSCPEAVAAPPAYTLPRSEALKMVHNGAADLVNVGKAIRLTFDKEIQLRGCSLRIVERVLMAYADGEKWARAIVDMGWLPTSRPQVPESSTTGMPTFSISGSGMVTA